MIRNKKDAFYVPNFIAILLLHFIALICFLIGLYNEGLNLYTLTFLFVSLVMTLIVFYYFYNLLLDERIRKYGYKTSAKIIEIIEKKYKYGPVNNIIVYEYKDKQENVIVTRECVNRIKHEFTKGESINVLTDGKKALLDIEFYPLNRIKK